MTGLEVTVGSLALRNPVMPASGTFEYHPDSPPPFDVNHLGAIVPKSLTLYPQLGNRPSRLAETPSGLINSIGIPSLGLERFLAEVLPRYEGLTAPVMVSVAGYSPQEYLTLTEKLSAVSLVAGIELNLSCPNLDQHRMPAQDVGLLRESVKSARSVTDKPLWAKLSLEVTSIVEMAQACLESGADAVTLINTFRAMAIDSQQRRVILGNGTGGLSGPAIRPMALAAVWDVSHAVDIPVIGVGGITTVDDALMFLLAGASAIQIGTASFRQPLTMVRVIEGLTGHLAKLGVASIAEIIGAGHLS
ncbi:MAG: dihydroorotate dehydrogenase [Thermaerobacter sp.]|nr:dihydroorotate dehydrogenase [Thermaerobacter sp.]